MLMNIRKEFAIITTSPRRRVVVDDVSKVLKGSNNRIYGMIECEDECTCGGPVYYPEILCSSSSMRFTKSLNTPRTSISLSISANSSSDVILGGKSVKALISHERM